MPAWPLIAWLAIGASAGLVSRRFIGGTPPIGKIGDMILGIAGRVVGGFLVALAGVATTTRCNAVGRRAGCAPGP